MSSFKKIVPLNSSVNNPDDLLFGNIWGNFKNTESKKEIDSVSFLKFDPNTGKEMICGASTRLNVYTVPGMEKVKSMSKSADVVHCVGYRSDGKLFAVGNAAGNVQIFDSSSKKLIRHLKGHKGPVRKLCFSPDKLLLYTVSDDRTFKVWDVPGECELATVDAHDDYIRACAISRDSKILVTGSYDHKIKVWNLEDRSLLLTIDHESPVEDLLLSPSGSMIVSCGLNTVKLWDISIGGKLLHFLSPHQKTITSIAYNSEFSYLITGALDRHAKIIDLTSYRVVHSFKFESPVMCVACNSTDNALAFGLSNGASVLKTRKLASNMATSAITSSIIKFDFVAPRNQTKFTKYERAFKSFKFRDALDECIAEGSPRLIMSCFTELMAFDALELALSGRDETSLLPVLRSISKLVRVPEYVPVTFEVFTLLLDMYGNTVGQSYEVDELFKLISREIRLEIGVAKDLLNIGGQLDMICSSNQRSAF